MSENEPKKVFFFHFCLLLKAVRHAEASALPEGVPRNHLFSVDFLKTELKTAEKVFLPAFRCCKYLKAGQNP